MVGFCRDLGLKVALRIDTDFIAANSMGSRRREGKVRHIDVRDLWLEEKVSREDMVLRTVPGVENLADIEAKHVPRSCLDKHLVGMGVFQIPGRHPPNPNL
jgi:hypothetical protein